MENLQYILQPFIQWDLLLIVAVGTLFGFIVGALPGLSVTMGVTLLVSLTYSWDTTAAIVFMVSAYVSGIYGGSRTAILMNIPGSVASLATTFDGYPLAQQGEAGRAIGIATIYSCIGGTLGIIVFALASPLLADFALSFASRDYFLLMVLGLLLVGSLGQGSMARSVFSAGIGVIVGLVGIDLMTGEERFTLGLFELKGGIYYLAALLGLFGFSEVLFQFREVAKKAVSNNVGKLLPPLNYILKFLPLTLRSAIIGVLIGALPGAGPEIAAIMAYDHAKKSVKKPTRPFGKGAYEGVLAPDTANMSATGGTMIPMMTLGIPGDAVTAVMLGAFMIHGLQPGPMLMVTTPDLFYVIVGAGFLSMIFVFIWGLSAVRQFTKITLVPRHILLPIIGFLTILGAYAVNYSITEVYWMIGFGVLGYFMKLYNFQSGPMVLGIILGPMLDTHFRRSIISEEGLVGFLASLVTHPISFVLTLAVVFSIFASTPFYKNMMFKLRSTITKGKAA
ncbi:tripartite tricarboxylate transporter permease [Robertmurraya andreesenii]|uniref:Tricarboxylic transport membrane protein n=1 Tax=Anoxybacillus andreesenii TaxID=1325932 RepID=A0ABT9V8C2_9BACL|nr:tripartite tricarboxylate transporter permease [Robertmurraya andreesenii]MDQ0157182.1 putative tricarboxylic transport membrane protein [Robertmurraya andreesenii]